MQGRNEAPCQEIMPWWIASWAQGCWCKCSYRAGVCTGVWRVSERAARKRPQWQLYAQFYARQSQSRDEQEPSFVQMSKLSSCITPERKAWPRTSHPFIRPDPTSSADKQHCSQTVKGIRKKKPTVKTPTRCSLWSFLVPPEKGGGGGGVTMCSGPQPGCISLSLDKRECVFLETRGGPVDHIGEAIRVEQGIRVSQERVPG